MLSDLVVIKFNLAFVRFPGCRGLEVCNTRLTAFQVSRCSFLLHFERMFFCEAYLTLFELFGHFSHITLVVVVFLFIT